MKSIELIDEIENLVFKDYLMKDIYKIYGDRNVLEAMHNLKWRDAERYQNLKNQIDTNANKRKSESSKIYSELQKPFPNTKMKLVKKIVANEITIFAASKKINISLLAFFLYLVNIQDKELVLELKPILAKYGFGKKADNGKSLRTYPEETQREILLVALTYRVSFNSLSDWFGTTIEDVIETFLSFDDLFDSVNLLFEETIVEDENSKKWSLFHAKEYWRHRNSLVKKLNVAKQENNIEKIEIIKIELNKLRSRINDGLLREALKKDPRYWTNDEKDLLAWYPLKYNLSVTESANRLGKDRMTIDRCQENLAERNMVFADKMNFYKGKFQIISDKYVQENVDFSRGGGSR